MESFFQSVSSFIIANTFTAFLLTILIALLLANVFRVRDKRNLPPRPWSFPFVGHFPYLLFLGSYPHKKLAEMSKKYGSIFGLNIGQSFVVVLGDYAVIKEALQRDEFLGRPTERCFTNTAFPKHSFIGANGQVWREHRRFALQRLNDIGYGKTRMEELMTEEISNFVTEVLKHDGKPFDFKSLAAFSITSNIAILIAGRRLQQKDTTHLSNVVHVMEQLMANAGVVSLHFYSPSWMLKVRDFMGMNQRMKNVQYYSQELSRIIVKEVEEHKKKFDPDNIRDYIDAFLLEMNKKKNNRKSLFNYEYLVGNSNVYFVGGSETLQSVLGWIIHLLAVHQDVQERAYREIVDTIGLDRLPTWADRSSLPYCQAVVAETHRLKTVVPLSLERWALVDATLQGFDIPQGTRIVLNLWAVHHNPAYWKDPENFNPRRFLNEDETMFVKNERVIPFSLGKRSCIGEQMAHVEIFLYFVSLLQRVKFVPRGGCTINLDGVTAVTYEATSMDSICFLPRK